MQPNLIKFYIFYDLLNYKKYKIEYLNIYNMIELVFCNYFTEFFIEVGYSFDEMDWISFLKFFEEFFVESLFNFYYMQNFSIILDYFSWRILNIDFS